MVMVLNLADSLLLLYNILFILIFQIQIETSKKQHRMYIEYISMNISSLLEREEIIW